MPDDPVTVGLAIYPTTVIVVAIIFLLIGFMIGFALGGNEAIKWKNKK